MSTTDLARQGAQMGSFDQSDAQLIRYLGWIGPRVRHD